MFINKINDYVIFCVVIIKLNIPFVVIISCATGWSPAVEVSELNKACRFKTCAFL